MKRASATLGLIGVLAGVPIVLLTLGGGPTVPSFDGVRLTDTYMPLDPVLELVGLLTWILWAFVAGVSVLRAAAVAIGPGSGLLLTASSRLTPRPLRLWVDLAIGGALLASTINPRAGSSIDQVARAQAVAAVPDVPRPQGAHAASDAKPANVAYRVRAGDSLWRIAERKLGSGFRWREIFELNRGKSFNHSQRLMDPRLIRPGWVLELPKRASPQAPRSASLRRSDGPQRVEYAKASKSPAADTTVHPSHRSPSPVHPVTRLPSGLVIATSFASGLLTAELLALLKRRRRFRPLADSVEQPADPDFVRELRGSGATRAAPILDAAIEALTTMWMERFNKTPPIIGALERGRRVVAFLTDVGTQLPPEVGGSLSPRITFRARQGLVEAEVTGPFSPHLDDADERVEGHGLVPVCHASDAVLHLAPFGLGNFSIEGPRADGMVLQMLIASATRSSPDDLEVILLGAGDELRAAEALPHLARSVSWDDADDALRDIQAEFLRRARLFFRDGVENARAHKALRPEEQLSRLLIVAEAPPNALRGVVEAVAVEASRLGAAFVSLGWRPQDVRIHALVADHVELDPALFPQAKAFAPFVLDAAVAGDAVAVLRSAFIEESTATDNEVTVETESVGEPHRLLPIQEPPDHVTRDAETKHEAVPARPELLPPTSISVPPAPEENGIPCAEFRCLGPIIVARGDGTIPGKGWRAPAKELLSYLVLHPDGVHKERLAELLLPGMPTKKALDLVARAASVVRTRVRTPGDDRKYVELEGETWHLERGVWRVDAWDMERLIDEERHAEPDEAIAKLRAAVALYRGEFSDDAYFEWAQPARERYRALFLRASAQLAERLNDAGDREDALATLDRAIEIEPLCEDLYRQAMLIEASFGRRKEALQRFGRLKQLLASELNCNPDLETEHVARHIERVQTREHLTSASRT